MSLEESAMDCDNIELVRRHNVNCLYLNSALRVGKYRDVWDSYIQSLTAPDPEDLPYADVTVPAPGEPLSCVLQTSFGELTASQAVTVASFGVRADCEGAVLYHSPDAPQACAGEHHRCGTRQPRPQIECVSEHEPLSPEALLLSSYRCLFSVPHDDRVEIRDGEAYNRGVDILEACNYALYVCARQGVPVAPPTACCLTAGQILAAIMGGGLNCFALCFYASSHRDYVRDRVRERGFDMFQSYVITVPERVFYPVQDKPMFRSWAAIDLSLDGLPKKTKAELEEITGRGFPDSDSAGSYLCYCLLSGLMHAAACRMVVCLPLVMFLPKAEQCVAFEGPDYYMAVCGFTANVEVAELLEKAELLYGYGPLVHRQDVLSAVFPPSGDSDADGDQEGGEECVADSDDDSDDDVVIVGDSGDQQALGVDEVDDAVICRMPAVSMPEALCVPQKLSDFRPESVGSQPCSPILIPEERKSPSPEPDVLEEQAPSPGPPPEPASGDDGEERRADQEVQPQQDAEVLSLEPPSPSRSMLENDEAGGCHLLYVTGPLCVWLSVGAV